MLTVKINDSRLEQLITDKARLDGKSSDEIVNNLLQYALPEPKRGLHYKKLNPEENGYIINFEVSGDITTGEEISLFSQVENTANYIETIRKNAWRKS